MNPSNNVVFVIHPEDNVGLLRRGMRLGDRLTIAGHEHALQKDLAMGSKVALMPIPAGEKIIKYGVPIGTARVFIGRGDYVHLHNLTSDYIDVTSSKA